MAIHGFESMAFIEAGPLNVRETRLMSHMNYTNLVLRETFNHSLANS